MNIERRQFLGLAATTPFAAGAAIKAAMTPQIHSGVSTLTLTADMFTAGSLDLIEFRRFDFGEFVALPLRADILPNPFITEPATISSLAETPAASTRLKCGDAAGSSTPLGGTATAPGMARGFDEFTMARVLNGVAAALDAELLNINERVALEQLSDISFSKA